MTASARPSPRYVEELLRWRLTFRAGKAWTNDVRISSTAGDIDIQDVIFGSYIGAASQMISKPGARLLEGNHLPAPHQNAALVMPFAPIIAATPTSQRLQYVESREGLAMRLAAPCAPLTQKLAPAGGTPTPPFFSTPITS